MPPDLTTAQRAVVRHVSEFFADRSVDVIVVSEGPIEQRVPGFRELCVSPGDSDRLWMFVSCGAWDAVHVGEHGLEFFLLAPERHPRHALIVAMIAYYHANPDETYRLDIGHTAALGEPWVPGSPLDHLLVSAPYTYGPEFEMCHWDEGHARLLWLLPITEAERDFKAEHGLETLEQRFDDARVRYWDPYRPAVV